MVEHLADVIHRLGVLLAEPGIESHQRAEQRHQPLDQRLLDAGPLGRPGP